MPLRSIGKVPMRIEHDLKLTFDDVLIRPKRSTLVSRSDVTLIREFKFRHSNKTWTGVPIVAANMDTTGVFGVAKVLQNHSMLTCLQKFYSTKQCSEAWNDNVDPNFVAITCGSTENSLELLKKKMSTSKEISMICVDVANGYREIFLDYIKEVRMNFPDSIVIAGNVATREMTEALILAGADVVKVGIGPGSICTTRIVTGVGVPQVSAVAEVTQALKKKDIPIIADGGIRFSGDIAKAIAAGGHTVMLGSVLAGTEAAPGE